MTAAGCLSCQGRSFASVTHRRDRLEEGGFKQLIGNVGLHQISLGSIVSGEHGHCVDGIFREKDDPRFGVTRTAYSSN